MSSEQAGYRIEGVDTPDDQDYTIVGKGLHASNIQHAGENGRRPLCLFLHAPGGEVVGDLVGSTYWDWFYVDLFWLREDVRGQGHGHRLIEMAENEARQRGARHSGADDGTAMIANVRNPRRRRHCVSPCTVS